MEILIAFWKVLAMMAPWLLGGFLLAGIVGVLMPREWAEKAMGKAKGWKGVLNAVLIGVPLPICSCGVLPLTQALRKSGASKGAAAGFLISTPQTGIDSILATYALLGPVFAIARPIAAFLTGIIGGEAVNLMTNPASADASAVTRDSVSSGPVTAKHSEAGCCCCCSGHKNPATADASAPQIGFPSGHRYARGIVARENVILKSLKKSDELFTEIVKPLSFGLVVAALVTVLVPENFFATAFGGNDFLAMPAMVIIGFPMYVCSTASIPIAASMVLKGLTPGAAFVFLMVGPAINAASLSTVASLIGKKPTIVYALVISLGAILCGIAVNMLPFEVLPRISACCEVEHLSILEHVAAGVLVVLIAKTMIFRHHHH